MRNSYRFEEKQVALNEINPTAIEHTNLREIHEGKIQALEKGIIEDGMRDAIIIRKLTVEEQAKAKTKAHFGIIDGHHRYQIAKNLGHHSIKAVVIGAEIDAQKETILAARMNFARVNMAKWEKGKIISALAALTGENAVTIGRKCFEVKKRMTYKYLEEYRNKCNNACSSENATEEKDKDKESSMNPSDNERDQPYNTHDLINAWEDLDLAQRNERSELSKEFYTSVRTLAKEAQAYASYLWKQLRAKSPTEQVAEPEETQEG